MTHRIILFFCFFQCILFTVHTLMPVDASERNCPPLSGRIVKPKDAEYDKARLDANYYTSKNKFPKSIVYCQNTQDVQNAVKWARCHNVAIRVRSGGHHHEGYSTGNDVVVIDVSAMKKLDIDKNNHRITVQPGVSGGELYSRLFQEGLTQVGGTCEDVGISGLILTGGMGPLLRREGMACDSLISLKIVDANGDVLTATKDNEHKDLFWASCGGGGGNFGIVTEMVLKVYPAQQVTWFNIGWDWSQPIEQVITAWQKFFGNGDRKWFSHLDVWAKAFPSEKFKKQPVKVLGVYYGTPEEAKRELAPLLNIGKPKEQTIQRVNWHEAIKQFEDSTSVFITDKPEYKSTGAYAMKPLPDEAVSIIVETLRNTSSPLFNVLLFSLGGATQDIAPTATAYFYRNAQFFVDYSIQWLKENEDQKQIGELDTLRQRLLPYTTGDYIGNPDPNLGDYLSAYYGENVQKLREIKRKYDPQNIFHFEQSIPPETLLYNLPLRQ